MCRKVLSGARSVALESARNRMGNLPQVARIPPAVEYIGPPRLVKKRKVANQPEPQGKSAARSNVDRQIALLFGDDLAQVQRQSES